jgi:hypothetical protein
MADIAVSKVPRPAREQRQQIVEKDFLQLECWTIVPVQDEARVGQQDTVPISVDAT